MPRFATLPKPAKGGRFANLRERMEAPLPGEEALVPSTDPKYAQRLPAFRPQVPASAAKASTAKVASAATVTPKAPIKSAAMIATEAYAERAAKVMNSNAANGKKKAAAQLLGTTRFSADQIINFLATAETDAQREQAEIDASWNKAIARANTGMAGLGLTQAQSEISDTWKKAIAKVEVFSC